MNYDKLVHNLRRKAYDYNGDKDIQFKRVLREAKKRKIANYIDNGSYARRQERLLFRTS
jgi:transcription antitermination factor NusA-like protein